MTCMHSLQNASSSVKAVNTFRQCEVGHDQELFQAGHHADGIFLLGKNALTGQAPLFDGSITALAEE